MIKILVLLLLLPVLTFAKANYWLLTDLGLSAEQIAYGGVEGFSNSADSVFGNPAGLFRVHDSSFSAFSTRIIGEVDYFNFAWATRTKVGVFGFGYMHAVIDGIPFTAEDSFSEFYALYNFDYKNTLLKASYQYSFSDKYHVGISYVDYTNAFQEVTGRGNNIDFGGIAITDKMDFSISVRNFLGREVEYGDDGSESLYSQITTGIKFKFSDQVKGLYQIKTSDEKPLASGGFIYSPYSLPNINFMAGVKQFLSLNEVRDTMTLGFTLIFGQVEFHYAYERSDHVEYDNNNYFSISVAY